MHFSVRNFQNIFTIAVKTRHVGCSTRQAPMEIRSTKGRVLVDSLVINSISIPID